MIGRDRLRVVAAVIAAVLALAAHGSPASATTDDLDEPTVDPLAVSVTLQRAARLVPASGEVELRGSVDCSRPSSVTVQGLVEQDTTSAQVGPRQIDCPGYAVEWAVVTTFRQGPPLHAGPAQGRVVAHGADADGTATNEVVRTLRVRGPRIAFARSVGSDGDDPFRSEIFTVAAGGGDQQRLTRNAVEDSHPAFSPDGRRIAFTSSRRGSPSIYVMNADGSRVRRLTKGPTSDSLPDWSPNGKWIVFTRYFGKQRQSDLVRVNVATGATRRLTRTKARELAPSWSPDGKLIAFAKLVDAKDRYGIAVIRPRRTGLRWLTKNPRARRGLVDATPTWSPTGADVAFARDIAGGGQDIFTVRRTGKGLRRLTRTGGQARLPSWGADGRVALVLSDTLATMNSDGTQLRPITNAPQAAARPYWYPDWAHAVPD